MIWTVLRRPAASVTAWLLLVLGASGLAGCGALDVSDPTAIEDSELDDASGAELLRSAALRRFYRATATAALDGGMFTDEFFSDPPAHFPAFGLVSADETLDRRESERYEQLFATGEITAYAQWQEARRAATVALPKLRAYAPAPAHVGEMFALRGYAALRLAEDVCPGFPLHEIVDLKPVYGPPLSTDDAFTYALAEFDSALVYAADSARVLNFARVGRARALLGLGRFADAAATAELVPDGYVATGDFSGANAGTDADLGNPLGFTGVERSVADQDGGTGLDFVTASDPRVPITPLGTAHDGVTGLYGTAKYPDRSAPVVLASDVEARLIEAEAALHDEGDWLGILNALRTTCTDAATCPDPAPAGSGGVAGLPPLADPGTFEAQVDLLFRERAFWLFGTGHRLGDLRRLIRHYDRSSEAVFPTGSYRLGGAYGAATSVPFAAALETPYNPAVTGCTSR